MSTEPDYNFSEPVTATVETGPSLHLPFALLTLAVAIIMLTQTVNTFKARATLRDGKVQLTEAYKNREPMVKQSVELQNKLQAMILDLLLLAKTDEDAKAIIGKYNIQQQAPAAGAPAATPETPAAPQP